jgi:DUF2934 family protein
MQHSQIRELAYRLWQERGCPAGSAEEDWLAAERQLSAAEPALRSALGSPSQISASSKQVDDSLKDTFPASDPPGSQLPDRPPANADAKWEAAGKVRKETTSRKNSSSAAAQTQKNRGPRPQGR